VTFTRIRCPKVSARVLNTGFLRPESLHADVVVVVVVGRIRKLRIVRTGRGLSRKNATIMAERKRKTPLHNNK
jgi:hypothetical protein